MQTTQDFSQVLVELNLILRASNSAYLQICAEEFSHFVH